MTTEAKSPTDESLVLVETVRAKVAIANKYLTLIAESGCQDDKQLAEEGLKEIMGSSVEDLISKPK